MKPPIPSNESERVRALQLYDILDTLPEKAFDEITQLAAHICGCPIATVSIIEENRQWYKSRVGMDAVETPRDIAFCSHTICQNDLLVVPDTLDDERFATNPVVVEGPKVRFYAGAPLINKEGYGLGTLCVVDLVPRDLTNEQVTALEALSRHVVILLELRRAEREVTCLNNELEQRVQERTEQLNAVNVLLRAEMEEKERIQQQMVQIQKMEAIGRLAGGIAHDFNNILHVIGGYCELLLDKSTLPPKENKSIQEIQKSGKLGASLVRQLLTFSRRQVVEPKILDINDVMQNMSGMLVRLIGANIDFKFLAGDKLFPVRADASQLEQVIMNLVINACDAMPNGGQIMVRTSAVNLEKPLPYEGGEIEPNRYTILTVQDSGSGMSSEIKAKIFEPFFTTKPIGKGTGLGLATCFGIIQQCRGFIRCDSELGRGTTFHVFLPASQTNMLTTKTGRLAIVSPRGKETVLLVEDDLGVRELTCTTLQTLGYTVLEAGDGLEAIALLQSRSMLKVDLLMADVVMPHLSGPELMERVASLRPEIKCLLTSGYADDTLLQREGFNAEIPFLQKPYTTPQLGQRVRQVLDSKPA
jgi:signal transduction histidine kinase